MLRRWLKKRRKQQSPAQGRMGEKERNQCALIYPCSEVLHEAFVHNYARVNV